MLPVLRTTSNPIKKLIISIFKRDSIINNSLLVIVHTRALYKRIGN